MVLKKTLMVLGALAMVVLMAATPKQQSMVIPASDNAYILADVSTTDDPQGLRDKNFKNQLGILVAYQNQVQAKELIVDLGLTKFDLTPLKGKTIRSATMQLYALSGNLKAAPAAIDVSQVTGAWSENDVTYTKKPDWNPQPIASEGVYAANRWYSWDVSSSLVPSTTVSATVPADVSYVLGLHTIQPATTEQLVFAARAAADNQPRLIVTYDGGAAIPMWYYAVGAGVVIIVVLALVAIMTRSRQSPPAPPAPAPKA